jgi:hypothetical protein
MKTESLMITEEEVINSVVNKLEQIGFYVKEKSNTIQETIDIYAVKENVEFFIEAKGGTTSKNTSRKGKPFNGSQVKTHIAMAILKAMQIKQIKNTARIGIALPNDRNHKRIIDTLRTSIESLNIEMIWSDGKEVILENEYSKNRNK